MEDQITKIYIESIFSPSSDLQIKIGFRRQNVIDLCREDPAAKQKHLGLIDRDFSQQHGIWRKNRKGQPRYYILSRHEIENYMLDPVVLSKLCHRTKPCNGELIKEMLKKAATQQVFTLTGAAVLRELDRIIKDGFPSSPKVGEFQTKEDLFRHFEGLPWRSEVPNRLTQKLDTIEVLLETELKKYQDSLDNGDYVELFWGKQLLNKVLGKIDQQYSDSRTRLRKRTNLEKRQILEDTIRRIGGFQAKLDLIPQELHDWWTTLNT